MEIAREDEGYPQGFKGRRVRQRRFDPAWSSEVIEIVGYIHDHLFDKDLNVGHVFRQCGVTNNNASSRFKVCLGVGVREYIEQERMEAAKQLLRSSTAEVYLIAETVGYDYVESFVRAFSRSVGCTPCSYRARHRELEFMG